MNLKRLCLTPLDFFFYILTISINHNYVINQYNNPTGIFLYLSFYPTIPISYPVRFSLKHFMLLKLILYLSTRFEVPHQIANSTTKALLVPTFSPLSESPWHGTDSPNIC